MATKVKKLEKELKTAMKDKNIVNFFNAVMVMNLYSTFSITSKGPMGEIGRQHI